MAEKSIFDEFMVPENGPAKSAAPSSSGSIFDEFMVPENKEAIATPAPVSAQKQALPLSRNIPGAPGFLPSVGMGALDVGGTIRGIHASMVDTVDRLFKQPNRNLAKQNEEGVARVNKLYDENYKDLRGSEAGRVTGQMAASAPLIPGAAISTGIKTSMGAMPTILSTGEKIAAPMVNRLAAASATGGVVGGAFGALTSSGTDEPLSEHVGKNILAGMVGGPVVEGASMAASKVAPALKSMIGNTKINTFANKYGITPQAARNVMASLENEGMTLAEAEAKLTKFGPEATIADLTPALQQFVGALSKRGELSSRTASIIKNRYGNRADTADDRVVDEVVNKNLGAHKDVSLERGKLTGGAAQDIHEAAQNATRADYNTAYANPKTLSVYSLIGDINKQLESAAGAKSTALKEAKGYLYKTVKDPATGQDVQQIRTSVKDLHESRQALDDLIEKRGDALPPRALRSVQGVRDKVDEQLKTIPEMKAADEKFSKAMDIKQGLKIGYEALKKGNRFSFDRTFDAAPPEVQQTIREGMRAAIGDHMDMAAKGDLSGAAQLFADRNLTRHKLVKAFGPQGEQALEALEKHITMRATERFASTGSITNASERINSALDQQARPKGAFGEAVKGAVMDVSFGNPGVATAVMGAKRFGGNIIDRMRTKRHDLNVESLADLVSRSGKDRDNAITVLQTVDKVQKKMRTPSREIKLPVILSAPIGEPIADKISEGGKYGGKLIKHWYGNLPNL